MEKVFCFSRVSSVGQDIYSLDGQIEECRTYCESKGYTIVKEFREIASAKDNDRVVFNQMLDEVEESGITKIIIARLDRFSRSPHLGRMLYEELKSKGVGLESVAEKIEATPTGILMLMVIWSFSEAERSLIKSRCDSGRRNALASGNRIAGKIAYGYNDDSSVHPEESKVVRKIFSLKIKGLSNENIAKTLNYNGITTKKSNLWSKNSVRVILKNNFYLGKISHKGKMFSGNHPAIVSPYLWLNANKE